MFSAGNDGNRGCSTTGSPADSPHAYAVGAHDLEGQIASFSSRGPTEGRVSPDLTAPGVEVRSSVPGGGYSAFNGTSMAAPHVAGAVGLLWSAAPSLVGDVHGTRELLDQTAVDTPDLTCGGTPEHNNVHGEGRLDAYPGYLPVTTEVTVSHEDAMVVDLHLAASTEECVAAGYRPSHTGLYEEFASGSLPQGWSLATGQGDGWTFDDPGDRGNLTGAEGRFASIDSAYGARREDGWLLSPVVDLSGVDDPVLSFRTDLIMSRGIAEVELSLDGGESWSPVWQRGRSLRGALVQEPLPQAAGEPTAQLRFHYRNDVSSDGFWQLDEVLLGQRTCQPVPGGLVIGQVRDDRTDASLDGATVTGPDGQQTTTVDTPGDAAFGGGFYQLFAPVGEGTITVSHPRGQYHPAEATVPIGASQVARVDFALSSGELVVDVTTVVGAPELGTVESVTVTVTNVGSGPAQFQLAERAVDPDRELPESLSSPGAPLRLLPTTPQGVADPDAPELVLPALDPTEAAWVQRHDSVTNWSSVVGAAHDGKLYVISGASGVSQRNQIYDISEDRWELTGSFMPLRREPAAAFVGDLLYVVGGAGPPGQGTMSTTLIYDPATDSWSNGADAPVAVARPGYAVLDGRLYVVGGRTDNEEQLATAAVTVYDPATDTWTQVADYPEPAFSQACGPIDGLLYCAGGQGPDGHLDRGYVYHPDSDTWHRIADLPQPVTRGGYTAANGLLLLSGGVVGGYRSNQGYYYDPGSGQWASMPNALWPLERMASACGFYKIAGYLNPAIGSVPWVEQLPGFDDCDTTAGDRVPWLSAQPAAATVAAGGRVRPEHRSLAGRPLPAGGCPLGRVRPAWSLPVRGWRVGPLDRFHPTSSHPAAGSGHRGVDDGAGSGRASIRVGAGSHRRRAVHPRRAGTVPVRGDPHRHRAATSLG